VTAVPGTALAGPLAAEARGRYASLIDALLRDGQAELAAQCADLAVAQGFWTNRQQRPVEFVAGGSTEPVYDAADFWFVAHLEANYDRIRAELNAVTDPGGRGFRPVEEPLLDAGRWDQVVLYEAGARQHRACELFPLLTEVIEQIPEATTLGPGVVTLSWLHPGAHIVPHCGRTNAQLRVHLGLRVPDGTSLRVGDRALAWTEGRCLVFDDSFEHEVWHRGSEPRVVLLLDVLYPDLDAGQRERLLARRGSAEDRIAAYLTAHDLTRIEADERGAVLRPAPGVDSLVRRYLAELGVRAVELVDGRPRFEYG